MDAVEREHAKKHLRRKLEERFNPPNPLDQAAKDLYDQYEALINAGFSPEQATSIILTILRQTLRENT